jgi:hypothetical protein
MTYEVHEMLGPVSGAVRSNAVVRKIAWIDRRACATVRRGFAHVVRPCNAQLRTYASGTLTFRNMRVLTFFSELLIPPHAKESS